MSTHSHLSIGTSAEQSVEFQGGRFLMPLQWPDADVFSALFPVPVERVTGLVPEQLVPVRWLDGAALIAVQAARVNVFAARLEDGVLRQADPFGMVLAGLVVAEHGSVRAPLALTNRYTRRHGIGALELLFPLTSPVGVAVGRDTIGEPKFVADIAFAESRTERRVTVRDDGRTILCLRIRPGGPVLPYADGLSVYAAADGVLRRMATPSSGHRRVTLRRDAASLELGDHPAVEALRALGIGRRPVMTTSYLDFAFAQYPAKELGRCRPLGGYPSRAGAGAYTVDYEGVGTVDLHAGLSESFLRGADLLAS